MSVKNITNPDAMNSVDLYCRSITVGTGGSDLEEVDNVSMVGNSFVGSTGGSIAAPVKINRLGNLVTLNVVGFSGNLSGTVYSNTTIPVKFRPPAGLGNTGYCFQIPPGTSGQAAVVATGIIGTTGTIILSSNPTTTGAFTNVSIVAPGFSIPYSLNF